MLSTPRARPSKVSASLSYRLVAARLADLPLLDRVGQNDRGLPDVFLVCESDDLAAIATALAGHPMIAQTVTETELQHLSAEQSFASAHLLVNAPHTPMRFAPERTYLPLAAHQSLYRALRLTGMTDIELVTPSHQTHMPALPLLDQYTGRHHGERAYVIGNGPSLNQIDMTRLKDALTFGSNRSYLGFERWGYPFTYWAIEDRLQIEAHLEEYAEALRAYPAMQAFAPFDYAAANPFDGACYFPLMTGNDRAYADGLSFPAFSANPRMLYQGYTVTMTLIQLAALMGASEIVLLGVDHSYGLSGQGTGTWTAGDAAAPTHFDDRYTKDNRAFVRPRPVRAEMAYMAARRWGEANGVKILNATPGSQLDVFERADFAALVG